MKYTKGNKIFKKKTVTKSYKSVASAAYSQKQQQHQKKKRHQPLENIK